MNLHNIARGAIGAINPFELVKISVSRGYKSLETGDRLPLYTLYVDIPAQIQALTFKDLTQIEGLNQGGEQRSVYLYGKYNAVLRPELKGGDLLMRKDGSVWLMTLMPEQWPDWCKAVLTRQNKPTSSAIGAFVIGESTIGGPAIG